MEVFMRSILINRAMAVVDSAKKKACLQHMDYDGFHQMVLGANLMPVKPGAINIYNAQSNMEFNHGAAITSIQQA